MKRLVSGPGGIWALEPDSLGSKPSGEGKAQQEVAPGGRSEAPAVYLLLSEQSLRSHQEPLASSPPQGRGCLPEGTMEA